MRILPIATLLLLASTAAEASTARARPGVPTGGRLAHAVVEAIDEGHATLTFVLTTTSREGREVIVPIDLPEGMTATGLTISMGRDAAESARTDMAGSARAYYDRTVVQIKDPALLEWAADGRLRLSVFPVVRGTPARVTIELTATDQAADLACVDRATSLIAAPGRPDRNDPYADYWPAHRGDDVVAHSSFRPPTSRTQFEGRRIATQ